MRLRSRRATLAAAVAVATVAGTIAALPASAAQTTYYVGGAGCTDSGSGTQAQPFCTITKGVSVVTAGQTVIVNPGTYSGQVTIASSGTAGNPVTVKAATPGTVTVTGGTDGFVVSSKHYVTIDGFTVTGTSGVGIKLSSSDHLVLSNNTVTFSGHPVSGQNAAGVDLSGVSSSLVIGNKSDHNSFYGFHLAGGTTGVTVQNNEASWNAEGWQRNANGIDVVSPGNVVIGNVLHDNEDSGLQFYTGGDNNVGAGNVIYNNGDHGIDNLNVTGGKLIGNTVFHNCTDGINVEGTSGNYTVVNNVAVDNAVYASYNGIACSRRVGNIGIYDSAPSGTIVDYNVVNLTTSGPMYHWGSSSYSSLSAFQSGTGQGAHDIQADPKFVSVTTGSDSSGWNLHLQEGSAAIDSANSSVSGQQTVDADGNSRVDDPNVANTGVGTRAYDDRGAYEFQGGGALTGPTAVLTVTPASGTVPLTVAADASGSTPGSAAITAYTFDFGDGTVVGPQAGASANHTFGTAGSYTVRVTAKDANNLTGTTTQTVTANPAGPTGPTAALTVSPSTGTAPLAVSANASASTPGSSAITSYTFDFGDGSPVVGPQPAATANHSYPNVGNYTATVTVTDTNNLTSSTTAPVTVTAAVPPGSIAYVGRVAANAATGSPGSPLTLPSGRTVATGDALLVSVLLSSTGTGPVSATDTQGDSFSVITDVTDGGSGDRSLLLAAFGSRGLSTADSITLTFPSSSEHHVSVDEFSGISAPDQHAAAFGAANTAFDSGATPATTSANELVFGVVGAEGGTSPTFAAGYTALPVLAVSSDRLAAAYKVVSQTGSFSASGSVTGQWMAAVATFLPSGPPPPTGPTAALAINPASGTAPLAVSLDASASAAGSSAITSYTFDFGDGSPVVGPQAGATTSHSYSAVGTFTAKVTAKDANNLTSTATQQVTTTAAPVLTAALTVTPTSGTAPLTVSADASGSTPGGSPIATYTFDFGDGSPVVGPQAGATAGHTYATVGTFLATVTVTDTATGTATATKQVSVTAPVGPTAALSLTPSTGSIPLAVSASGAGSTAGSSAITSYTFDFGDGSPVVGPQAGATASHTYQAAGTFTVTLTVKDGNNLSSTATKQVVAQSGPPPATIAYVGRTASAALVTTTTSVTVPVAAATQAGDSLVVSVMLTGTSPGTFTASDTKGDVYTVTSDVTDASKHRTLMVTAFATAALTTSDSVTLTFPSSSKYNISVDEFSGIAAPDKQATLAGAAGGTSFSTPAVTTTAANELLVCAVGTNSGTAPTFGAGWNALPGIALSSYRITTAYQIVSAIGSYSCSGSTTAQWGAALATFK